VNEVAGFANTSGGLLLIGVSDDGKMSGIRFAEVNQQFLDHIFRSRIKPTVHFFSELMPVSKNKCVLVYHIQKGENQPYAVLNNKNQTLNKVYLRVKDECV